MRLWLKSACVAFVLTVIYSMIPFGAACSEVSHDVFRLHILANSDSEADQAVKLKVRDCVLAYTEKLYRQAKSKEEAERVTAEHLQEIADAAAATLRENNSPDPVRAELVNMFFTTRYYENYTLPSGNYDALRLTIGKGEGHNWWCVMFPSLCVSAPAEQDSRAKEVFNDSEYDVVRNEKREYRFFIMEMFEKIRSVFAEK